METEITLCECATCGRRWMNAIPTAELEEMDIIDGAVILEECDHCYLSADARSKERAEWRAYE